MLKHARARAARVRLEFASDNITLEVSDDGVGFEPALAIRDHGLDRVRDVAARLGGTVSIQSSIGRGTRVLAKVPR